MTVLKSLGQQLVKIGQRIMGKPLSVGSKVFSVSTPEVYASVNDKNAIEEGFNANTAVYSVVMEDALKFGSIPRYVYDAKKKEEKSAKPRKKTDLLYTASPALTDLLNRPNPQQSQDAFLTLLRAFYKVTGNGFIWMNRGDLEAYRLEDGSFDDLAINRLPVLEMQVLPSNMITIIPDPSNLWGVLGYVLETPERVVIRKDDVIHWKMPNLKFAGTERSHLFGMAPLTPGSRTLGENNAMSTASMRQAQNDGAKAIIYNETMGNMSPEQQSQLKRVIDAKINNNDVAGAVAAIQGKWGVLDLGKSSHDMELLEAKKMSYQELCYLFGVPYENFNPDTTFNNKEWAQKNWVINKIIPDCKQLDGEFNRQLLKAFNVDGKAIICTDASEMPEMQKDLDKLATAMTKAGCFSKNEIRSAMGWETIDDPKMDMVAGTEEYDDDQMAMEIETNRLSYEQRAASNGKVSQKQ